MTMTRAASIGAHCQHAQPDVHRWLTAVRYAQATLRQTWGLT